MKTIKRIALIAGIAVTLAHGAEPQQKLTVYLRFRTVDRYLLRCLAQDVATRMFAGIGIPLEWKTWQPATESLQAPIVIDVVSETPDTRLPGALGYSLINGDGHITIFLDRIEKTKYPGYVMAYAMVHEITHVLQGVSRHSDTGVMKARWDLGDFCQMRLRRVPFASEDVGLIYDGLAARRAIGAQDVTR
jgi:hypothetical protein